MVRWASMVVPKLSLLALSGIWREGIRSFRFNDLLWLENFRATMMECLHKEIQMRKSITDCLAVPGLNEAEPASPILISYLN